MENCTKELMKKYENIEKIIEKIKEKGVELTTYHMRAAKKELFEYYLKLAENENFSKEVLDCTIYPIISTFTPKELAFKYLRKISQCVVSNNAFYKSLPENFYVYRGCLKKEWESKNYGMWWSTDPGYAGTFAGTFNGSYATASVVLRFFVESKIYIIVVRKK
jgi:hypothetical protein